MGNFTLIKNYISTDNPQPNKADYLNKFITSNVIVNAYSNHVCFTKKRAGLSVKCAFKGSEIYETDNGRFKIDDSCYLVLNRENLYSGYIDSNETVESFSVFFEKEMADDVLGSLLAKSYEEIIGYCESGGYVQPVLFIEKTYPHDKIISPALYSLRRYIKGNFSNTLYLESQFHLLLSLLFTIHKNIISSIRSFPSIKPATKIELFKRLNRAKDFMDSSFDRSITLKQVSARACLSQHHFLRMFRKVYAQTPHQYLTAKRLEMAKKLLMQTNYHITEISRKTGYENLSTFSRLFKQHFFTSPELYRNLNKTKKSISVK